MLLVFKVFYSLEQTREHDLYVRSIKELGGNIKHKHYGESSRWDGNKSMAKLGCGCSWKQPGERECEKGKLYS